MNVAESKLKPLVERKGIYNISGIKVGVWTTNKNHNVNIKIFDEKKLKTLSADEYNSLVSKASKAFHADKKGSAL